MGKTPAGTRTVQLPWTSARLKGSGSPSDQEAALVQSPDPESQRVSRAGAGEGSAAKAPRTARGTDSRTSGRREGIRFRFRNDGSAEGLLQGENQVHPRQIVRDARAEENAIRADRSFPSGRRRGRHVALHHPPATNAVAE